MTVAEEKKLRKQIIRALSDVLLGLRGLWVPESVLKKLYGLRMKVAKL